MNTFEQIYFLIGILGVLVTVGIVFTFVLPVPSHKQKAKTAVYGRLFLIAMWFAFLAICLEPLGYHLASAATLNFTVLLSMYMLLMTVIKRYGLLLRRRQLALIVFHLLLCELVTLYFYYSDHTVLYRESLISMCTLIPLSLTLRLIYRHIPENRGGDELIFLIVAITTIGIALGVPFYLFVLPVHDPLSINVAFVAIFMLTLLFMLGFPASLMQSLFYKLSRQAYIDALTGAKNRHYLYREATRMLAHTKRHKESFSAVVCDIDYFKNVNDQYGHPVGDEVLKQFTRIIGNALRTGDTLIRMGGEEFLIILPSTERNQACIMAERLCESVRESDIDIDGKTIKLTASFGVASLSSTDSIFDGIRQADEALYRAKASGRDQVKRAQS